MDRIMVIIINDRYEMYYKLVYVTYNILIYIIN